jgi:hypothetical protein
VAEVLVNMALVAVMLVIVLLVQEAQAVVVAITPQVVLIQGLEAEESKLVIGMGARTVVQV